MENVQLLIETTIGVLTIHPFITAISAVGIILGTFVLLKPLISSLRF